MPDTPDGNDGDGGKKRTVRLFGHDFDKKKAVMAGLGGLLVLALAGGGIAYAVSQQPEPDAKPAVEQKGSAVIELVKKNIKANPNADEEKVEEESKKAEESGKDSAGDKAATKPDDGNSAASGGSQNQGGGSSGNGGSGSSGNSGSSKPQHTHNWEAQTTTVHHDAVYKTVHHDAVVEYRCICNGCGADITGFETQHFKDNFFNGCQSYTNTPVTVKDAWDEQVLVSAAWDETITTGYKCSTCGAVK